MNRLKITGISIALGAAAVIGIQTMAGAVAPGPQQVGPPAVQAEGVPQIGNDLGVGEHLILVAAGSYATEADAEAASAALNFGELQGFYVAEVADFGGLRELLPGDGEWALVSAFRTKPGAAQFAQLAEQAGAKPLVTPRLVSLGGTYAGLGQEAAPDGSGPLSHAVPASQPEHP